MLKSALIAFALIAVGPLDARSTDDDVVGWVCERTWSEGGISGTVARYLTARGRQKEMYVEWWAGGSSDFLVGGFAGSDRAFDDIPLDEWSVHIGWTPKAMDSVAFLETQIVLGPPEEGRLPPNARWPGRFAPDLDLRWGELRRHVRAGKLQGSLVDEHGHVVRSGAVAMSSIPFEIENGCSSFT